MVTVFFPKDRRLDGAPVVEREIDGEGPETMDAHTVRYWSRHTKELRARIISRLNPDASLVESCSMNRDAFEAEARRPCGLRVGQTVRAVV